MVMSKAIVCLFILAITNGFGAPEGAAEFDRLRAEGFDAIFNLDYGKARERFRQMVKMWPDHPAGYLYLANSIWLEALYERHRLLSSFYVSRSFYAQGSDRTDSGRGREFNELIKKALDAAASRLRKNPKDAEALYYQASALGLRAAYEASVLRAFTRAIGDANDSILLHKQVLKLDQNYIDAELSIGLYEYIIDTLPFGWRMLARVAGLKGSKRGGIARLEKVASRGKYAADDARVVLIGLYTAERDFRRALELIEALANKYPRNYLFRIERGRALYRLGQFEEGARQFEALLADQQISGLAADLINYQWGEALFEAGKYSEAIQRYKLVKVWPKSDKDLISLSHLRSGQALDALGHRQQAVVEYRAVLGRENVYDSHERARQYIKKPYAPSGD
jgi:tetratricopeptide (TPR) repeat protein